MGDIVSISPDVVFEGYPNIADWYEYARTDPDFDRLFVSWQEITDLVMNAWLDEWSGVTVQYRDENCRIDDPVQVMVIIEAVSIPRLIVNFSKLDEDAQVLIDRACEIFWKYKIVRNEYEIAHANDN